MRYVVIGLGVSGKAVSEVLLLENHTVIGIDQNPEQESILIWKKGLKSPIEIFQQDEFVDLSAVDKAIVSPGVSLESHLVQKLVKLKIPVIGEAEFALSRINNYCIGITGSNGKTTTTLFIAHLLKTAGLQAVAIGNVGTPFSEYLLHHHPDDICVCELSSYQLETLKTRCLDFGVILEITPDHMDRYPTFEAYAFAKFNMLKCLKTQGQVFVSYPTYTSFAKDITSLHAAVRCIPFEFSLQNKNCYLQLTKNKEYCDFLPLIKEKALGCELLFIGASLLKAFSLDTTVLYEALASFKKPEHRLELVDVINDITFYNDSKATNVESVLYAVKNLEKQIYLIVGGKDKNLCFDPWIEAFKDTVEHVFAIGESAKKIQSSLDPTIKVELCVTLENALRCAYQRATPRSKILLSPGCASFDQFKDYRHRGECFKKYVTALKQEVV